LGVVPVNASRRISIGDVEQAKGTANWFNLGYVWHPHDDRLLYIKQGEIWLMDLRGGHAGQPQRLGSDLGKVVQSIHWFTRDGSAIIVGTDPVDDGTRVPIRPQSLALVPLDGAAPTKVEIDLDEKTWSYTGIVRADAVTVWQPDGHSVILTLQEKATGENALVRFDLKTGRRKTLQKGYDQIGGEDSSLFASNGSHRGLIGAFESYKQPLSIRSFSSELEKSTVLDIVDSAASQTAVGSVHFLSTDIPTYDGKLTAVRTAVLLPPGSKKGDKLPAIVMLYPGDDRSQSGKLFGGSSTGNSAPNAVFTAAGFAVVLVDARVGPSNIAGDVVRDLTDSVLPQVRKAAELGFIDINRVAVSGQSGGGYASAAIITRTNLFRAAITVNGHYDLPGFNYARSGPSLDDTVLRLGSHPWQNILRYIDNSPYYQADKIQTPVMIVAGGADRSVEPDTRLFSRR